jgi:1-acyl-sn-glycerol-3-phosphate acyltransferase
MIHKEKYLKKKGTRKGSVLLRYSLKLILIALFSLPLGALIASLAVFDRKGKLAYRLSRLWTWLVLKTGGVGLKIRGLDRLDSRQSYIFMANHQSNIDIPVLVQSFPQFQLRWIAKRELVYVPVFGWALWSSRHILVARGDPAEARATLRKAKKKLEEGASIILFPEGTRSRSGELLPFKRGGFLLALRTKAPVVPVTVNGSARILPRGDWRIRSGEVEVVVGEPISLERYRMADLNRLVTQVRNCVESNLRSSHGAFQIAGGREIDAPAI